MKQKVVIKVSMNGNKSRSKALKLTVSHSGVESVGLGGQDKNQIEVTGEGIDAATLTALIRKKMGFAELVSVTPVAEKKDDHKDEKEEVKVQSVDWTFGGGMPHHHVYDVYYQDSYSSCSIM